MFMTNSVLKWKWIVSETVVSEGAERVCLSKVGFWALASLAVTCMALTLGLYLACSTRRPRFHSTHAQHFTSTVPPSLKH